MTRIQISGLFVERGDTEILKGITTHFGPGEFVGLIGPNGAGKTTLLKSILGLVKSTSGLITIDDRSIDDWPRQDLAKQLGYLPQGAPVNWPMTVETIVGLGRLMHRPRWGGVNETDAESIARAMDATEVTHLADRHATTLSGGEKTRVMIARCLAGDAPLLLVDEPITGLDPAHALQVMDTLKSTVSETSGVISVLHDLSLAMRYCDRLVLMHDGQLVADDLPASVLTANRLSDVYGIDAVSGTDSGVPYVLAKSRTDAAEGER